MFIGHSDEPGLLVKPEVARKQIETERVATSTAPGPSGESPGGSGETVLHGLKPAPVGPTEPPKPRRFHGSVLLDPTRVGRDAGRIAEEVIAHLAGLTGAQVKVTIEIEADIPEGAPDNVVRTVTENSRTLKFTSHGFEAE